MIILAGLCLLVRWVERVEQPVEQTFAFRGIGILRAMRRARRPVYIVAHFTFPNNARLVPAGSIWVRQTQFAKYFDLDSFHQRGIGVSFMVIAQQMQAGMNNQMGHMVAERATRLGGLPHAGFQCNRDIAQLDRHARQVRLGQIGHPAGAVGVGLPRNSAFRAAIRASSHPMSDTSHSASSARCASVAATARSASAGRSTSCQPSASIRQSTVSVIVSYAPGRVRPVRSALLVPPRNRGQASAASYASMIRATSGCRTTSFEVK